MTASRVLPSTSYSRYTAMIHKTQTACPACGAHEAHLVSQRDGKTGEPLTVVACARCGMGFIDPLPSPEALVAWYRDHYRQEYKGAVVPKLYHVLRAARNARHRLQERKPWR